MFEQMVNELPINCGDSFYSYLLKVTAQGGGHSCDNQFLTHYHARDHLCSIK